MTIPGAGDSASVTSAAPVPFSTIFAAASRSVCDGPTVRTTSDIPSLTCIVALSFERFRDRADRLKTTPPSVPGKPLLRGLDI